MSLVIMTMLGNPDGVLDVLTAAGVGVANASFSREMELEADAFAFGELQRLGRDAADFQRAMELLRAADQRDSLPRAGVNGGAHGQEESREQEGDSIFYYLRSHPDDRSRIERAAAVAACQQQGKPTSECLAGLTLQ